MAERLQNTTSDSDVTVISAITSAFPPALAAAVPTSWSNGLNGTVVPEFDVDVSAAGATAPTAFLLYGAQPENGVIAGATFTSATTDISTAAAHGLITGDGPVRLTTSGTLPAGFALLVDYWIIWLSANTLSFAASRALAFAGTAVDVTDTGSGTHTMTGTAAAQLVKWRNLGTLSSAPTLSLREGFARRSDHNPKFVAYGVVWTGGTTNVVKVKICPVGP